MTSAGTPVPSTEGTALPTRRELRAREAAQKAAGASGSFSVPVTSVAAEAAPVVAPAAAPLRSLAKAAAQPVRPAPVTRRSKSRNPVTVAVTLMAIPGLFLTAALPAYAFTPGGGAAGGASASRSLTTAEAQGIAIASGGATLSVARDGFTATTKEELEERDRQAKRAAAVAAAAEAAARSSDSNSSGAYAVRGERAEGDDYPWPYAETINDGGGLSPLGYYYRECVDFVAWRLNRDAGSTGSPWRWKWGNLTPGAGSASSWKRQWENHGWATSDTPVVGAVAWFTYNHVAYVQSVPGDGTVVLEEYNWMGSHAYHTRTVSIDSVPKYLYPPA